MAWGPLTKSDGRFLGAATLTSIAAALVYFLRAGRLVPFLVTGVALALLAACVGRSVDRLGDRLGSGATGVVQSALGNLPELFIGIFALRAGLITVLQAALVGSILANLLLVLGAAFIAGGMRHGPQRFSPDAARLTLLLLVLATAVVMVPTIASHLAIGAAHHEGALSDVAATVLLLVFVLSIPAALRDTDASQPHAFEGPLWPIPLVLGVLVASSIVAALVSDWFISALTPALSDLHVSGAFAGLVIVAIAGNAVENFVGVRLAFQNRPDYALAVILQSPVQIALGLIPALVLLSNFIGPSPMTLVMPTMLVVGLGLGSVVAIVVVVDGESTWLEGVALIGLYVTIAAAFWWS